MNSLNEKIQLATEELIDLCRNTEINFRKGNSEITGFDILRNALEKGIITLQNYIEFVPAISYPENDYELKIEK